MTEPRRAPESPTMEMTSNKEVLRRIEYTGDMLLNMGPQHPSTHGVINFLVQTDGEVMKRAIPEVGYLHRSIEKIGEKCTYNGFMPYTDRVDYIAAMFANQGWAMAVERLLGASARPPGAYGNAEVAGDAERYGAGLLDVSGALRKATGWWALWRVALAAIGAWLGLAHARRLGQLRKTPAGLWPALFVGAGAYTILAPLGVARLPGLGLLALPPAAIARTAGSHPPS